MAQRICKQCDGAGVVESHRSRWIGGGKTGFRQEWTVAVDCEACEGSGWQPIRAEVVEVAAFEIDGATVTARGFEREQFLDFVKRAKHAQLRTAPSSQAGVVMVQSGSSDARYATSRVGCSCPGHYGHGRCYHRALVIHLVDVEGVDIFTVPTIGVNEAGRTVTVGRKVVGKAVA